MGGGPGVENGRGQVVRGPCRSAHVTGSIIHPLRVATGQVEKTRLNEAKAAGRASGRARKEDLSPERRSEIARQDAAAQPNTESQSTAVE